LPAGATCKVFSALRMIYIRIKSTEEYLLHFCICNFQCSWPFQAKSFQACAKVTCVSGSLEPYYYPMTVYYPWHAHPLLNFAKEGECNMAFLRSYLFGLPHIHCLFVIVIHFETFSLAEMITFPILTSNFFLIIYITSFLCITISICWRLSI